MPIIRRLVLDVLKPHHPDSLELASSIADLHSSHKVFINVLEMDEKTETIELTILGEHIDFEQVRERIAEMGGSLHSIDQVEVHGDSLKKP